MARPATATAALVAVVHLTAATAATASPSIAHRALLRAVSPRAAPSLNLFADVWEQPLEAQTAPPAPLLPALVRDEAATYVLQEKLLSWSGEDFRVRDSAGRTALQVSGANVNLGGWVADKLRLTDAEGRDVCSVERRIVAATTCYDLYREGALLGAIERRLLAWTPTYRFSYAGTGAHALTAEGSFTGMKYTIMNTDKKPVARVGRGWEVFKDVDQYLVEVAPGVDAAAVVVMALVIDEDHDEAS